MLIQYLYKQGDNIVLQLSLANLQYVYYVLSAGR